MNRSGSLKRRKVLVTGAAGFLASHLCALLGREEACLFALLRPGGSRPGAVPGRPALPKGTVILEADLRDGPALTRRVRDAAPEVVFHLAALTDVRRDPALEPPCRAVNLQGTKHLAEALVGLKVKRVVHFGTCEEYGDGKAPFREDHPVRPVSPYSASKAEASLFMAALGRRGALPVTVLRPFLAYGPGQSAERFLAACIDAALADRPFPMTPGEQTREFDHVEDLVEGARTAAVIPGIEGEIINLACGEEHRLLDVAEAVYRLAGAEARPLPGALPYRQGEAMRFFGHTEKCRRLLGYEPRIHFDEGLRRLVAWTRARRLGPEKEGR